MPVALANLDLLGSFALVFGVWIAVALFVGPAIGRWIRGPQKPPTITVQISADTSQVESQVRATIAELDRASKRGAGGAS